MLLLIIFLILVKVLIFKKMNQIHLNSHQDKICPKGYFGNNSDPYDCSAYYMCPHKVQMFCEPNHEFDLDSASCVPIVYDHTGSGCTARMYRNLLI
ncbi:Mv-ORF113 peptide [Maruca vitrata nucleopolyhedrovirus]|uniref:Mv-ORF113 peptide n=1 Tax=Maruca vitrata nucleopolyhedrovirus TaxID=1307954 RepID=A1YRH5_9ABAC|nr:Mv-ORF113 peptide [Maruca vitrata nucleopolyhedrovirus]ABM05429.1 Mv-ORF113 peptide [Maruca vitrata nucleopolyhedrovirus]